MQRPRKFGKYLLLDRLASGGMAEVFLAKSIGVEGFEKVVAIKRILPAVSEDPDFETMFIDEAKISARLAHSNIGAVFEFGEVDDEYYIAMEYIPGKDLRAIQIHLEETDRMMEVNMALHIVSRISQALDYAHRKKDTDGEAMNIIHRDISPPNIIVSYEGAIKLIDFGIAKATSRATRTRAGKLKGKFSYMSPEQVQGMSIDHRSDIFSLGTLLHELLTNRRLFHGESQLDTMHEVRRAAVNPPSTINPDVPLAVDQIVLKALARDRAERYGWASELRADIERFLARSETSFDSKHLVRWMKSEFPGDIQAEQKLRERLHDLKSPAEDQAPAAPDAPEQKISRLASGAIALTQLLEPDRESPPGQSSTAEATPAGAAELPAPAGPPRRRPPSPAASAPVISSHDDEEPTMMAIPDMGGGRAAPGEPVRPRPSISLPSSPGPPVGSPLMPGPFAQPGGGPGGALETGAGGKPAGPARQGLTPPPRAEITPTDSSFPGVEEGGPTHQRPSAAQEYSQEYSTPAAQECSAPAAQEYSTPGEQTDENKLPADDYPDSSAPWTHDPSATGERGRSDPGISPQSTEATKIERPHPSHSQSGSIGALDRPIAQDDVPSPRREASVPVDIGIDGEQSPPHRAAPGTPVSSTHEVEEQPRAGLSSLKVILIAGVGTMLLAGLVTLLLVFSGDSPDAAAPDTKNASIVVTTRPAAACTVLLDGRPKGMLSPGASLSLPRVTPGQHRVDISCIGFAPFAETVAIQAGKAAFMTATLKKK